MVKLFFLLMILLPNSLLSVSGSPETRIGPRMVYDTVNARIILYGGAHWDNGYTFYGELWSYQLESNAWTKLETINNQSLDLIR